MALAAHWQIIGDSAPINKSRQRRPQIVGGGAAGARLYDTPVCCSYRQITLENVTENLHLSFETWNIIAAYKTHGKIYLNYKWHIK